MSIQDDIGVYDTAEFADNPEARCSIVLVTDISGSMYGPPMDTLNQALTKFGNIIREDPVTALRADVAIIAFCGEAGVVQDFTNGTDFNPPVLPGIFLGGGTEFAPAVNLALDLIEARKQSYRDGGIAYYRSLGYFLTDGYGSDDSSAIRETADRLYAMEERRSVAFFPFTIGGHGDMLRQLFPREPVALTNMEQLDGSIQWLSRSVAAVSQSQPGESIRLPQQDFRDF